MPIENRVTWWEVWVRIVKYLFCSWVEVKERKERVFSPDNTLFLLRELFWSVTHELSVEGTWRGWCSKWPILMVLVEQSVSEWPASPDISVSVPWLLWPTRGFPGSHKTSSDVPLFWSPTRNFGVSVVSELKLNVGVSLFRAPVSGLPEHLEITSGRIRGWSRGLQPVGDRISDSACFTLLSVDRLALQAVCPIVSESGWEHCVLVSESWFGGWFCEGKWEVEPWELFLLLR